MQEAIEGRGSHDGVAGEDLAPIGEGPVARQQDGLVSLVAFTEDLEEQACLGGVESEIADLVEDQQRGSGEILELASDAVLSERHGKPAGKIDGAGEVDPESHLGDGDTKSDGEVSLANA